MKRIISLTVIINLIFPLLFAILEPQVTRAVTDAITVTAEVTEEISISSPADVLLASSIPGMTGNPGSPASGSATWTVITNNATGFNFKIKASTDPAMQNSDGEYFFFDYTPAAAGSPDYDYAGPAAGSAEFSYSVTAATAADADTPFRNNGASCGTGANNTDNQCWWDLTTADVTVISRNSRTSSLGEAEKVNFRAESNGSFLKEGYYDAVIIITVVAN